MSIDRQFGYVSDLQCSIRDLRRQLKEFRSGEKYQQIMKNSEKIIREKNREISALKKEVAWAHAQIIFIRGSLLQVNEDLYDEMGRKLAEKDRIFAKKDARILEVERQRDAALDDLKEMRSKYYETASEKEDALGKVKELQAQINRDYENSSIPSSQCPNRKKIQNNREKTERKPGGQPGHKGHSRKKQVPDETVRLGAPQEVLDHPQRYRKEKEIVKQFVEIYITLRTVEYRADLFRDKETGERIHACFPDGVVDEVNYGGHLRSLAFILNNLCNVSIDKTRAFLFDITDGKLTISKGMINHLSHQMAEKTAAERQKCFSDLLLTPVMHSDATVVRLNGKQHNVYVCASPDASKVLFFSRASKGHKGIEGTPVEKHCGTLVHDHDTSYYKYGTRHQECLAHVLRYLKDSIANEAERQWNTALREKFREMIHYRKSLDPDQPLDPETVEKLEQEFRDILEKAKEEYEGIPASDYYKDGYNLFKRITADPDSYLLFLHDPLVPYTNNTSERLLRSIKGKAKQVGTFRSDQSISDFCDCKSTVFMLRGYPEQNLYHAIAEIFG